MSGLGLQPLHFLHKNPPIALETVCILCVLSEQRTFVRLRDMVRNTIQVVQFLSKFDYFCFFYDHKIRASDYEEKSRRRAGALARERIGRTRFPEKTSNKNSG